MFQPKYEGVPSNNPAQAQTAVDMFGKLYGSPEDEAARLMAEKQYDYAMAEAQAQARRDDPRSALGMDTEEQIQAEIFGPLNAKWNPQPPIIQRQAALPQPKVVGRSLAVFNPETGGYDFQTPEKDLSIMDKADELEAKQLMQELRGIDNQIVKFASEQMFPGTPDMNAGAKRALGAQRQQKEQRLNEILSKYRQGAAPPQFTPGQNSSLTNGNLPRILSIRQR